MVMELLLCSTSFVWERDCSIEHIYFQDTVLDSRYSEGWGRVVMLVLRWGIKSLYLHFAIHGGKAYLNTPNKYLLLMISVIP